MREGGRENLIKLGFIVNLRKKTYAQTRKHKATGEKMG